MPNENGFDDACGRLNSHATLPVPLSNATTDRRSVPSMQIRMRSPSTTGEPPLPWTGL